MSNSARRQLGLEMEKLRIKMKNESLPSHDLHLGQDAMMQDHASKRWSPAVTTRLCKEFRSYPVTTRDNIQGNIQEDTSTPEAFQASIQECAWCKKL